MKDIDQVLEKIIHRATHVLENFELNQGISTPDNTYDELVWEVAHEYKSVENLDSVLNSNEFKQKIDRLAEICIDQYLGRISYLRIKQLDEKEITISSYPFYLIAQRDVDINIVERDEKEISFLVQFKITKKEYQKICKNENDLLLQIIDKLEETLHQLFNVDVYYDPSDDRTIIYQNQGIVIDFSLD